MTDNTFGNPHTMIFAGTGLAEIAGVAPFRSAVRAARRSAQDWLMRLDDANSVAVPPAAAVTASATSPAAVVRMLEQDEGATDWVAPSELILRNIVGFAVITMDMDGRITEWNTAAEQIIGYSAAEAVGRSGEMLFTAEDRARDQFTFELCHAMETGRAVNERWHLRRDGRRFWASGLMMPLLDGAGRQHGFLNIMSDRTEARAEAEQRELLMAEMNHRVKNIFAMVQSIASQTARHAGSTAEFNTGLEQRLAALSHSHDLLVRGHWQHAPLRDVIERSLMAFGEPSRVSLDGLAVILPANLVVTLTLAFHELATNAVKHGALSVSAGGVDVRWTLGPMLMGVRHVDIVWRERGGPPVTPPRRVGFGSQLLERALRAHSGATLRLDYEPHGLECRISVPLTDVKGGAAHHG